MISMIVAMNRDGAIGVNGGLPWYIPEDLEHFKNVTMGKPVVMGRKTYESIGRPLQGRLNIVLTRDESWKAYGAFVETRIDNLIGTLANAGHEEIMVIGGAEIYQQFLPMTERVYLTMVDKWVPDADAWFPRLDEDDWDRTLLDKQVDGCEFWVLDRKVKA